MGNGLWAQTGYVLRATGVMARDPSAAAERVRGRLDRRGDGRILRRTGLTTDELYPIDPNWLHALHDALGQHWPCSCEAEAEAIYEEIMAVFDERGLTERYGRWCDGSRAFTKAAWALTVHRRPRTIVETGVARGVTSRYVLEALVRAGEGRLASVDLPSVDSRFHDQIGAAVPEQLRERWTLVSGTSRQRLPEVLAELGEIDLFIHDSLHTGRNVRFELDNACAVLRPGGAILVDDVYSNLAFRELVAATAPRFTCIGANPDGSYRFGMLILDDADRSSSRDSVGTAARMQHA